MDDTILSPWWWWDLFTIVFTLAWHIALIIFVMAIGAHLKGIQDRLNQIGRDTSDIKNVATTLKSRRIGR